METAAKPGPARRCAGIVLTLWAIVAADSTAAELKPHTIAAFEEYMRTAEARIQKRNHEEAFLWLDVSPSRKRDVRQGKVVAVPWTGNGNIEIPDGLIHDWIGAVFIPGATLDKTLELVQDYDSHKHIYKPEVMDSRVLHRDSGEFEVYMRLLKKKFLTVVLDTTHDARWFPLGGGRYYSESYSTRIAEVQNVGEANQRVLTPGTGHGFLWRLNTFWRLAEREGGVYVECEAISLSRGLPKGIGPLINLFVRSLPKDSLVNTLTATRNALVNAK